MNIARSPCVHLQHIHVSGRAASHAYATTIKTLMVEHDYVFSSPSADLRCNEDSQCKYILPHTCMRRATYMNESCDTPIQILQKVYPHKNADWAT